MIAERLKRLRGLQLPAKLVAISWRDLLMIVPPVLLVAALAAWLAVKFFHPAPPDSIVMLAGPKESTYYTTAERYAKIIARSGVKVKVVETEGAQDNLRRLADRKVRADVGFVLGGLADGARNGGATDAPRNGGTTEGAKPSGATEGVKTGGSTEAVKSGVPTEAVNTAAPTEGIKIDGLMSLGSVFVQPIMVFYRGHEPVDRLTQLRGKRIAIGPEGSGTHVLATKILAANGMDKGPSQLLELDGDDAVEALKQGKIDAAFLMGELVRGRTTRDLLKEPGIGLMNFRQADAYVRRLKFLSRLTLPEGAYDLGQDIPANEVELVGPTVELIVHEDLHPALSDLLIAAAREIHGSAGMFRKAGEFPAPLERDFPISEDARRFYRSGTPFLYKQLPFWLASLVDRMLVVLVPLIVILIPVTRIVPPLYRWRVRSRIYKWYGALMAIERDMLADPTKEREKDIRKRLDDVEVSVNNLRTPLAFADQLYVLREHISWVRQRLVEEP